MIAAVRLVDANRTEQALMQQRAEQMCQDARAAAERAWTMHARAAKSRLIAQQMRSDIELMLAAARAGQQRNDTSRSDGRSAPAIGRLGKTDAVRARPDPYESGLVGRCSRPDAVGG
ncbi:hypothetical protein [Streptomyces sp. NPDC048419]|uniref:hypothetical protein n=1 Tax=Streptomyces sp. NPDC048419 TaxID=3365547 RepID=UPI0037130A7E